MFWVYILTNKSHSTLYVGVTGDIHKRMYQHRLGEGSAFTSRYRLKKLVYAESTQDPMDAIEREKQIKRWNRAKKVKLIESVNPNWEEIPVD